MYKYDGHSFNMCEEWSQCPQHRTETHMKDKLAQAPDQVRQFVHALISNAKEVEGWEVCDMEDGKCFADTIAHIEHKEDGRWVVCDNYERFFSLIYTYTVAGEWTVRRMYGEGGEMPYSFAKCMADASIMFTG